MQINIEDYISESLPLGDNDAAFLQRIYADGFDKYKRRVERYDFVGFENVLDAGCGFGQWSISLAEYNEKVTAIDINKRRIEVLSEILARIGISNIQCQVSSLEKLPFEDDTFSLIFCYGVIFLTDWKKTLREFARTLKSKGCIYLNANGFGWYKFLWETEHNKTIDYDPKLRVVETLQNTLAYERGGDRKDGCDTIINPRELIEYSSTLGLMVKFTGEEGFFNPSNKDAAPDPFFPGMFGEDTGIYEVVFEKI